jgi:inorganic pyrophosphatase/exopolyphosphatase
VVTSNTLVLVLLASREHAHDMLLVSVLVSEVELKHSNIFQKRKIKELISVPELHDAEKRLIKMTQAGMDVTEKRMQNIIPS